MEKVIFSPESNNMNPEKGDLIMMCLAQFKSGQNLIPFRDKIFSYNSCQELTFFYACEILMLIANPESRTLKITCVK